MFGDKKEEKKYIDPVENMKLIHFNTQYCIMSPYVDSTVVRTPETIIKGTLFSKENRFRSEEYLLNYRTNNDYLGFRIGVANFFQQDAALTAVNVDMGEDLNDVIKLPNAKNIRVGLSTAITSRRSVRRYMKSTMSLNELSNILYYAQGVSSEVEPYNLSNRDKKIKLRNTPSGGGLYPIEIYMYIQNVKKLKDGVYKYYPYSHSIKPININEENANIRNCAEFGAINAEDANLIVFYVYNLLKNTRKYGDSGMAYGLIEAGETAQNLQLVSTAIGYGCCDIGGYEKQYIEEFINIDGHFNHVVHMTIVGMELEEQ